ncbi:hypothetical protein BH11ARM2_BH11ARM2_03140 [soil metagenome]
MAPADSRMIVRTLSEGALVIQIGGRGEEIELRVKNDAIARFFCATADLAQVLQGVPIQLAAPGESVSILLQGDSVRVAFVAINHDRASCPFPAQDLRDVLEEIRALG